MSNYDLNQTQLNSLLNSIVSNQTHSLINAALLEGGLYPRVLTLPTAAVNDHGTVALSLGDDNPATGQPIGLYVEKGSNVTLNVDTPNPYGSAVVAAGDGNNVTLNDSVGGDTLVGGMGHDTLIGGPYSYLMAGSGPTVLMDSVGDDTLVGGTGDDTINSSGNDDTIYGGSGPDTIAMSGSGSALYAGTGYESISMSGAHDTIYLGQSGPPATDSISVTHGGDSIDVGSAGGVDSITAGSDQLNLTISATKGSAHVSGSGDDHLISYGMTSITVEGSNVTLTFDGGNGPSTHI